MSSRTSEKTIQQDIIKYLTLRSIFHFKTIACNKRGIPDIIAVFKGIPLFLEVKSKEGKVSELQKYQMNQIRLSGGFAYVVKSVEDVEKIIHAHTHTS